LIWTGSAPEFAINPKDGDFSEDFLVKTDIILMDTKTKEITKGIFYKGKTIAFFKKGVLHFTKDKTKQDLLKEFRKSKRRT
jgi:hypothetical protein